VEPIVELLKLTSIATLLVAYGITEAGAFAVRKDEQGKLPRWFVFIPMSSAFIFAIVEFFALTDTQTIISMTIGKRIAVVLYRGIIASVASVVVFELRKKIFKWGVGKLHERFDKKPEDQNGTPS
jgi:hypothetical protein